MPTGEETRQLGVPGWCGPRRGRKDHVRVRGQSETSPQVLLEGRTGEISSSSESGKLPWEYEQMVRSRKGELRGKEYMHCVHLPRALRDWLYLLKRKSPLLQWIWGWGRSWGCHMEGPARSKPRGREPRDGKSSDNISLASGASYACNKPVPGPHTR